MFIFLLILINFYVHEFAGFYLFSDNEKDEVNITC